MAFFFPSGPNTCCFYGRSVAFAQALIIIDSVRYCFVAASHVNDDFEDGFDGYTFDPKDPTPAVGGTAALCSGGVYFMRCIIAGIESSA